MNDKIAEAIAKGFAEGVISSLSAVVVIVLLCVWIWVKYPNNVKLVFAQILSIVSAISGGVTDKYYIAVHLEAKVGKSIEDLNKKVDGLDAEQIKIVLVRSAVRQTFIRDGVLIMRLQKKSNHGENMANVAFLYSQHLYSKVDHSLNKIQQEAVRLYTAKSLLKPGVEGLRELDEKFYRPLVDQHPHIQALLNQLEAIDNRGLSLTVFIQKMVFLGEKTLFRQNAEGVPEEVTKFINFLVRFANRGRGDETVDVDFRSKNIRVSFVLVALKENRLADDAESYIRIVEHVLPRDTESFYFTGWGRNISFVRKVVEIIVARITYLELKRERGYERSFEDGRKIDAVWILVRNRKIANFAVATPPTPARLDHGRKSGASQALVKS